MKLLEIMLAIWSIESGQRMNPPAGDGGRAVGPMQIHPIMVEECNRIVGKEVYTLEDRRDMLKSLSMCSTFLRHQKKRWYKKHGVEVPIVRLMGSWNSGSVFNKCTPAYDRKIKRQLHGVLSQ